MKITWFGHSALRIDAGETRILMDPFLTGNPGFSGDPLEVAAGCTHVLLTHGHDDHVGDTVAICKATGAQLVASFEVCMWLNGQGVDNVNPGNLGGTVQTGAFSVSFVNALHSSSTIKDGAPIYLGNPHGLIVRIPGERTLYHMGDTEIFSDMALINELYRPGIGIVPIGDRFTMGAATAALACRRFFSFETILPAHFGTFPMLDQSADGFKAALGDQAAKMVSAAPGESFSA